VAGIAEPPPPLRPNDDIHKESIMYTRAMQRIRRTAHQRRVHEMQRMAQVAADREQMRVVMYTHVR
jgi:hypothetical protein